jgi:alpha,alpha-trehalose phosphorylase
MRPVFIERRSAVIHRRPVAPPEHVYPIDEWRMVERGFQERFLAQNETIFAVANGYLGFRGVPDEGRPVFHHGTFVNGFHETWPIVYGEQAHGFAKTGQTMLHITEGKILRLYVDDEPLFLPTADLLDYERVLDMRAGTLDRTVLWETPGGKQVQVYSRRLVSFEHRHLAAIYYEVTVLNATAPVVISSELVANLAQGDATEHDDDPRRSPRFSRRVLQGRVSHTEDNRILLGHMTERSRMTLGCGVEHVLETSNSARCSVEASQDEARAVFSVDARPGEPIRLVKYLSYHTSRSAPPTELCKRAERTLDRAVNLGFDSLLESQRRCVAEFWERSDIEVKAKNPRAQQCLRFNLFQLLQASARAEGSGIGARGLTGQAYEGHYFWDIEAYVMPFLTHTAPRIARNLLRFRYTQLDKARQRASEVNQKGALFPWRTINGEEASAYYAAGTAQYHINADIMHALRTYVEVTGDEEFLYKYGAEMLLETARLWADLGFFSRKDGCFHIHGVTGPDEYNTVVNDNTFTNLMARENLRYAAETLETMRHEHRRRFDVLTHRTGLQTDEIEAWRRAAEAMYIPYDEKLGINPQDTTFLELEPWDFEGTPPDRYPLLLHFHPLVIYRHQVIKQADVELAMFLLGREFSLEQKRRNFDFYDPLTTSDSSLSACVQSIVAWEVGYPEKALEYLWFAALMDLSDIGGNVRDGAHLASIGGTWMAVVNGAAGMRNYGGELHFDPHPWPNLERLRFPLTFRNQSLVVDIARDVVTYTLKRGSGLTLRHRGQPLELEPGKAVKVKLTGGRAAAKRPARSKIAARKATQRRRR